MGMVKNNHLSIIHIYWGTAGNAGLYMDEIYQALKRAGYKQEAFVSYYYPFNYGKKIFFKHTEMEHCRLKGLARKIMQAFELIVSLLYISVFIIKEKPRVVNYSYVSRGNFLILLFLKMIKKIGGAILVITCHDVIPIIKNKREYDKEIAIKKRIFEQADYFLVHTENSKKEVHEMFNIKEDQILIHLFPLMDLSKLNKEEKETGLLYDFLFIGHMRPEKGISILFDAWIKFHEIYPTSKLCIAGNPNYYKSYLEERVEKCKENNIELKLGFIKDDEYIDLVKASRCVVFPYTGGTNSGVVSTVISLNRDVITSDIGMFSNNPFVPQENMFEAGRCDSLLNKLVDYMNGKLISDGKKRVSSYRTLFDEQVRAVYSKFYV